MKQSFHITAADGRIFGCSFRKQYDYYFGRITIWKNKEEYDGKILGYPPEIKDIPLCSEINSARQRLNRYCEEL